MLNIGANATTYLMTWVRPSITEMQVKVDAQSCGMGKLPLRKIVVQIVVSTGWINPYPLTDRIDATSSQDGLEGFGSSGGCRVLLPLIGFDGERGPVNTFIGEGG